MARFTKGMSVLALLGVLLVICDQALAHRPGRPVRLRGEITAIDSENQSLTVTVTRGEESREIHVQTFERTNVIEVGGEERIPIVFEDLAVGDSVGVRGRGRRSEDGLRIAARVIARVADEGGEGQ